MTILLNPLLEALEVARRAAPDAVRPDDEVTVDDQIDQWVFRFTPRQDQLGGGASISVSKSGLRILKVIREQ